MEEVRARHLGGITGDYGPVLEKEDLIRESQIMVLNLEPENKGRHRQRRRKVAQSEDEPENRELVAKLNRFVEERKNDEVKLVSGLDFYLKQMDLIA